MIKKIVHMVEVINDGCFYKKGTMLIRCDNKFAPSIEDYPKHCHFLTENFIIDKPKIFKIV